MAGTTGTIFASTFKSWLGAKGIWVVFFAALVPLILNGAWVLTHQSDVEVTDVSWEPEGPVLLQPINFTYQVTNVGNRPVDDFNVTLRIGFVRTVGDTERFVSRDTATDTVGPLDPGQSRLLTHSWTPTFPQSIGAQPDYGLLVVDVSADADDEIPEIDEFNNIHQESLQVQVGDISQQALPAPPANYTGDPGAAAAMDAAVTSLTWTPTELFPNNASTIQATVTNQGDSAITDAPVTVRVGVFPGQFASFDTTENVTLDPGASTTVTLDWTTGDRGTLYWVQAYVGAPDGVRDTDAEDNVLNRAVTVERELTFPEPPERATIKQFYLDILSFLYLPYLIPLVSLFYAAGVLSGDRARGNLPYILTRPVRRWALPVTRFVSGFLVSAIAVVAGLIATFGLLFGTPGGDLGYLTTPILLSLVSLFAYGALFTLVGVLVDRAYLVGVAFIAWETVVQLGHGITVNARPLVQDWVLEFTVIKHLNDAIQGWALDEGVQWLPESGDALTSLMLVLAGAVVALLASMYAITHREFEV